MRNLKGSNHISYMGHRVSLRKENLKRHRTNGSYDKIMVERLLKHLSKHSSKNGKIIGKERCPFEDFGERRVDNQVKLRCRQLPNVIQELRKAIMKQDWRAVVILVMILCHPGLKYYSSIIIKVINNVRCTVNCMIIHNHYESAAMVCFILLFSHPDSNMNLLQNFIRLTTDYILEEDVNKFIRIIFALRKSALHHLEIGKYIRKTGDYKVTRDFDFEKL